MPPKTYEEFQAQKRGTAIAPTATSLSPVKPAPKTYEEFQAQKKGTTLAPPTQITIPNLPNQMGASSTANSTAQIATPEQSVLEKPLRWVGAQFMKPVIATNAIQEGVQKGNFADIPKNVAGAFTGENTRSFGTRIQEAYKDDPKKAAVAALIADIALDPVTYTGVGTLTKVGKLAKIVSLLKGAGMSIEEGSKIAKMIDKSGKTAEELVLAGTKAEQAAKGQRSAITFMGKPAVPAKVSEQIFKATEKGGEALKKVPVVGAVIEKGRSLFNTTTGNPEVDALIQTAKDEGNYLKAKTMEEALQTEKEMMKVGITAEDHIQVANYLEKGVMPTKPELKAIAERHKKMYQNFADTEIGAGIKTGQHSFYYPHIAIKDEATLGDRIGNFLSPKKFSTSLGSAESRDIIKFQNEAGRELIGKAEDLGMKPLPNVKGLSHDLTWGQYKSLKEVEDNLADYGISIKYEPRSVVGRNAWGYFNPTKKEIVIASKRPTLDNVMETLKHEIVHSAHFQIAGNIEMYESFAKAGRVKAWQTALDNAKSAVREEWRSILHRVNGITPEDFAQMKQSDKEYYTKPTELLARVGQSYIQDPIMASRVMPKSVAAFEALRKQNHLFDILSMRVPERGAPIVGQVYRQKGTGQLYQSILGGMEKAGVAETKAAFGKPMFEENPALALAYRGTANAKAVSSAKLFEDVKQFATNAADGVEVKVPELKGLKFEPGVARQLDAYHTSIQPDEIAAGFRLFDGIQNWWKAQALVSPGYHLRNSTGNLWNNFLAGIKNPMEYKDALKVQLGKDFNMVTDAGHTYTSPEILDLAKRNGIMNTGQFTGDIPTSIESQLKGGNFNPFSQENKLFRGNRMIGGNIEDNAKLTNFMHFLKQGLPPQKAAMETKKFLFDYSDLTEFEQTFMKRLMPFYTFTRKNLPVQLHALMEQPGKIAGLEKLVSTMEEAGMGDSPKANEKYLSDYIKGNTPMRVKYNEKDKSYSYFLLGNWMPSYQAIDVLSSPDALYQMLSPIAKVPSDYGKNTSSFFKNSLDEYQKIENYPGEQTNYLGLNMPKKTAFLLSNIRLLNDLDKANPGLIFGGVKGQKSIWSKMGLPAVDVPVAGIISPSQYKYNAATGVVPSASDRVAGFLTGKTTLYKPRISQEYYQKDTDARATEMKYEIKRAAKTGDAERVKLAQKRLKDFLQERGK